MTATKRKLILLVIVLGSVGASEVAFVASIHRLEEFGSVMASKDVIVDSRPRRVVLMERNTGGFDAILLDRIGSKGNGKYEYWAELHDGARLLALSHSISRSSSWFDYANIDTADAAGTSVTLNPADTSPLAHRFDWVFLTPLRE